MLRPLTSYVANFATLREGSQRDEKDRAVDFGRVIPGGLHRGTETVNLPINLELADYLCLCCAAVTWRKLLCAVFSACNMYQSENAGAAFSLSTARYFCVLAARVTPGR